MVYRAIRISVRNGNTNWRSKEQYNNRPGKPGIVGVRRGRALLSNIVREKEMVQRKETTGN